MIPDYLELTAAPGVEADTAHRIIGGRVAPWNVYAVVSTGQRVAFAPGALAFDPRTKLNLDHDRTQPVGVFASSSADDSGAAAVFHVPPGDAGDRALADAASGLRDGLSVGAEILEAEETADGLYVRAARVRHVALLSEPAYPDAVVTTVAASTPTRDPEPDDDDEETDDDRPAEPDPDPDDRGASTVTDTAEPVLTAAGVAAGAGTVQVGREPYPYVLGGPYSMLRDAWASREGDEAAAARITRAQRMHNDPGLIRAAALAMVARPADVAAATGTTVTNPAVVPPAYRPELWTPLVGYEAPVYSSTIHLPISDFTPFTIPRELTRTGLSGTPADEVTPPAAGDITTGLNTVTPQQVMGSYAFSRTLAMSSNPAMDQIAMNALEQEWLKDMEGRAAAFFKTAANNQAASATYADGQTFIASARGQMAAQRVSRHMPTVAIVAPVKEYLGAVGADDAQKRPLLGWDGAPALYGPGEQGNAAASAAILGVPLLPEGAVAIGPDKVLYFAGQSAYSFVTPIMNFRFEASGTNPMVITLVKYSGVAFWTRYTSGVRLATNSTPLPLDVDEAELAADHRTAADLELEAGEHAPQLAAGEGAKTAKK